MERLIEDGRLEYKCSKDVAFSRLGLGFEKLDRGVFDPNKAYDKVAALGVKKMRIQSGWARTEKEEGVYDFTWLDEIVDNLLSRGLEPWICLCYGNCLYTELAKPVFGSVGCPPISTDKEKKAWVKYVEATVEHFHGRVDLYEIWNEPDMPFSWRHCENEKFNEEVQLQNAAEYGIFACETAQAVKRADSDAKVIGLSIAKPKNLKFIDTVMSTGLYKYIDYVTYHVYSSYDNDREDVTATFARIIKSYNPSIKLIQGESGCQSRSDGSGVLHGYALTEDKQRKYLLRTLICDLWLGMEFTSYFSTLDMIEALNGRVGDTASYLDYGYFGVLGAEFDENGIATGEYREKPSYYALSTLASFFAGNATAYDMVFNPLVLPSRRMAGDDCSDATLRYYPFELDDGSKALCYWNGTHILTSTYEGTVSFEVFGEKTDNIRLVDLRDGKLYRLTDNMVEKIGVNGIRFKNVPVTDVPMAIWFR